MVSFLVGMVAPAGAVSARTWQASTADEFALGTLDGTGIDGEGRICLAPPLQTLWGPAEGIVWAVLPDGSGGAFVALSGPGRVLRVARGTAESTLYLSPGESLVTALVSDGDGGVLAGLSPEGRVLGVPEVGEPATLVETGAMFVWALAREESGTLWIGTGQPGRLLRVAGGGAVEALFEAGEDPVRSLALLPGGGLVFGTGGRGRVIRIGPDGKPFVLFDAEEAEIVALSAADGGRVFALAASGQKQPGAPSPESGEGPAAEGGMMRVVVRAEPPNGESSPGGEREADQTAGTPVQRFRGAPGGALYRLDPDGTNEKIWETKTEMPFALSTTPTGRLLVATGDEGRLWLLDEEGRAAQLLRIASNQASALAAATGEGVLVGGTTDARVEWLGVDPRDRGRYLGPPIDAGAVADWGHVGWSADIPAGASLRVRVRSGNTSEPDETWSAWRELPERGGSGEVPKARWFQVSADMIAAGGASPRLSRVEVRYLPQNRPPSATVLSVEPPGVVWTRAPVQSSSRTGPQVANDPVSRGFATALTPAGRGRGAIRKSYEAGARTFTWTVEDPDGDRLKFALDLLREGESEWFPLATDLKEEYHSWDSRLVPDGTYRIRITADDSLDNPTQTLRRVQRVSDAFVVDNTRPTIEEPEWRRRDATWQVRFLVHDWGGGVAAVEYNTDGGEWRPLVALDGIADFEEERFEVELPATGGDRAPRTLGVRAADLAGNLTGVVWRIPWR
jgi:hypothetical protein